MTPREKARMIAARSKPRFLEIPRVTRGAAMAALMKERALTATANGTACLEREQRRLMRSWRGKRQSRKWGW